MGDVARIDRVTNFQLRCKSQITSLITSATKLISHQNFSAKSQYLAYLQTKKCAPTTSAMEPGQAAAWVSHLDVSLKSFLLSLVPRN